MLLKQNCLIDELGKNRNEFSGIILVSPTLFFFFFLNFRYSDEEDEDDDDIIQAPKRRSLSNRPQSPSVYRSSTGLGM